MKSTYPLIVLSLLILLSFPTTLFAQEVPVKLSNGVVILPGGIVGNHYTRKIEADLFKVNIILKSDAVPPVHRWAKLDGELPPGLHLAEDGTIDGKPEMGTARPQPYFFRVKVTDKAAEGATSSGSEGELGLMIAIKAPVVRLVSFDEMPQHGNQQESGNGASSSPQTAPVVANNLALNGNPDTSKTITPSPTPLSKVLTASLIHKDTNDQHKRIIALQLGDLGANANSPEVVQALTNTLKNENPQVRIAARMAINNIAGIPVVTGVITDIKGNPIPQVTITLEKGSRKYSKVTDENGEYEIGPLPYGKYTVKVETKLTEDYETSKLHSEIEVNGRNAQEYSLTLEPASGQVAAAGEFIRPILGFEQAAASSGNSVRKFFMDLNLSIPLVRKSPGDLVRKPSSDKFYGPKWRLWGNARIASIPQPTEDSIRQFATSFINTASELKVNEVAQAVEGTIGLERRLWGVSPSLENSDANSNVAGRSRFSISWLIGGGMITPISPTTLTNREIFSVNSNISPNVFEQFKLPPTTKFIAFVQPDRDRFFRHYYTGLRFKTFYTDNGGSDSSKYPGVLDVAFGQNELITGGRFRGGVMRVEGFFPLPINKVNFLSLYGTALVKLGPSNIKDPVILTGAPSNTPVPGPDTVIITVPQMNRDYYRLGVGVNIILLVRSIFSTL